VSSKALKVISEGTKTYIESVFPLVAFSLFSPLPPAVTLFLNKAIPTYQHDDFPFVAN
jgi:hypothetical protein